MSKPARITDIDWGEVFTVAARPVIAACVRHGLPVHFDCECLPSRIAADLPALQGTLHRVLSGFVDCVRPGGFMVFMSSVSADPAQPGQLQLSVQLATSDALPPGQRPQGALALEHFVGTGPRPWGLPSLVSDDTRLHHGTEDSNHALMFQAGLRVSGSLKPARVHAGGAEAWVLQDERHPNAALPRRLHRLGWTTRSFRSCAQARAALRAGMPPPARVVVLESPGNQADDALALWADLPPHTQRFFGVLWGSATITGHEHRPELNLHVVPISSNELLRATAGLPGQGGAPQPLLPLPAVAAAPRVLVVDDDEINRIVAVALLSHAGADPVTAADGLQAIALCEQQPPQVVLMDIDMLPLDGFETTRHLQAMQRLGRIPPFPILAATAGVYDDTTVEEAGMAGLLTKPLTLPVLQQALRRVLKGSLGER